MAKYRIVGGTPDATGLVELPDDANIIGVLYHPITGELNVVILQKAPSSPAAEKPEDKAAAESVIILPETIGRKAAEEKPIEEEASKETENAS